MHVAIYSLEKILFEGEASAVNAKTLAGEITVLDHHRPLIAVLTEGVIKITKGGEDSFFEVKGGFLEVEPENKVRILAEA